MEASFLELKSKQVINTVDVNDVPISSRTSPAKPLVKKTKLSLKEVGLYLN